MLFDPARHEPLQDIPWDEARVRAAIAHIVADTEHRWQPGDLWPPHPRDLEEGETGEPIPPLYDGACGVVWALHDLQDLGAVRLRRNYLHSCDELLARNDRWLGQAAERERASYLMGETPIRLLTFGARPDAANADRLAELIAGNLDHPARELMWGAPGTLLAALFLHQRTGQARWAELFRRTAAHLHAQLQWSTEFECHYWTQELYGQVSTYLGAVHGFVATASPLIRGRALLDAADWQAWQTCIANTVSRTAIREGGQANWPAWLSSTRLPLMQFCHGAPGFVICLGDFPGSELDALLAAAGEAIWSAGPLTKGSNLCHGSGGNGYAFLKLYRRTGEAKWLQRARAFAMHSIAQTEAEEARCGQLRYALWTGDLGLAIYLHDCLRGQASFPTLDRFYADPASA